MDADPKPDTTKKTVAEQIHEELIAVRNQRFLVFLGCFNLPFFFPLIYLQFTPNLPSIH